MKDISQDNCKETPGQLAPIVDFNKCEAKGPCIEECPYDVFEMQTITKEDYSKLGFLGKLKTRAHGNRKAYVVKPEQCHSCGICVIACPEKAIKLKKVS